MKIQMTKRISGIFIICMLLMVLSGGCMSSKNKYTMEEKKELVLSLLEEKYGEEFVGLSYASADLMQGHDEYSVYPKAGTEEDVFRVYGFDGKKGDYHITDGYFGVLIEDEYEACVRSSIDPIFSDYKLY